MHFILSNVCLSNMANFIQVVEISKGSKVKYELDKKTGLIKVIMCGKLIFMVTIISFYTQSAKMCIYV